MSHTKTQDKLELNNEQKNKILGLEAVVKIQMIADIIKIIDAASNRGTFKASEMSFVGKVYDELANGVNKATESVLNNNQLTTKINNDDSNIKENE
jgi:hypothetical protein